MPAVTALADVDICNMGLGLIGITNTIQSLNPPDPGSEQAKACAFHYPKARDWLQTAAPWNFCYTWVALAADGSNVPGTSYAAPGWAYAYQYPTDCLQPVALCTALGLRYGPVYWSNYWFSQSGINRVMPKVPYQVMQSTANPGSKAIYTDLSSVINGGAYLFYIASVTNTAMFDSMFSYCLAAYVGARAGGTLRSADKNRVQMAQQMAESMKLQALAQVMNAAQQDPERPSPSVSVRW